MKSKKVPHVSGHKSLKPDNFMPFKITDLLFGITSKIPNSNKHYFLCDHDEITKKSLINKVGKILIKKHKFGNIYLIKSGKGFHLVNFTNQLTLNEYAKILKEMNADPMFIEWVKKVKYGVLRLSRRSSHKKVPKLVAILFSPYHKNEDVYMRNNYFNFLNMESQIYHIQRVKVLENKRKPYD